MYHANKIASAALASLALASLAIAGWFTLVWARADAESRKATPEGIAKAAELDPLNTAYLSLKGLQTDYSGGDPRPMLERIVKLTPLASAPRIKLGLDAETRGDLRTAERWLLDAARVDRQYEPRWTLANFYFRQQRMDEFWKWLRAALEVSYDDRSPAFDLAWAATHDASVILERAVPPQREVLAAFVVYAEQHGADPAPAATRLAHWRDPLDLPLLDNTMDDLLRSGDRQAARGIWMELGHAEPPLLAAPDFEPPHVGQPRVGHGFDWWLPQVAGVTETPLDVPAELRISFDGMQPEQCELLRQYSGVRAGRRYVLHWESRGVGNGVAWRIDAETAPLRASDDWVHGELAFTAAKDGDAVVLIYGRPLGEARVEGSVELRHVRLQEQP